MSSAAPTPSVAGATASHRGSVMLQREATAATIKTIDTEKTHDTKTDRRAKSRKAQAEMKLENRLNMKDLELLQEAFMAEGDGYDNRLSLTKEQFVEALGIILNKGKKDEYAELFDKVDVTKEGSVDWDKFASHMLLDFYEKDDKVKATQVPQWKDIKSLPSPHKDCIQKVSFLANSKRYVAISKEGCVSMWSLDFKNMRHLKSGTDSCKGRDLWVTSFVILSNVNKIALAFTSKEIAFYDLSTKLEFNCQYKIQEVGHTPLCMDYWYNPDNPNEAIVLWGDTGGCVNAVHFTSANIALFERPAGSGGEKQGFNDQYDNPCLNVKLDDIEKGIHKTAFFIKHKGHSEWVRQVKYSAHLECFISCATTWKNSVVIGWMEKHTVVSSNVKTTSFEIMQGCNSFDYNEQLNLIATAGVNHHVCLWNPYVVSKPNGVLRGHMASVIEVQFLKGRSQLISFSKDKVLRLWDVQLQVCIQRLAGMFPKGPEVNSTLFFDEIHGRLFISFNYQLTYMEMRPEVKGRVLSHDKPIVCLAYNSTYNQIVSLSQDGTLIMWMLDTGQKVKQFNQTHGSAEVTTLAQDATETRIYTASTDGTVKVWDFNGHCYHSLECAGGHPADIGQILALKRSVLVLGWTKFITVFRNTAFRDFHVQPSEWKGGQEHHDDILHAAFCPPSTLATASYDGEIIIWNLNSEQASRHLTQRSRRGRRATRPRPSTLSSSREDAIASARLGGEGESTLMPPRPGSHAYSVNSLHSSGDDTNEFGNAISRLNFLETRKNTAESGGANLVSCGANGWVRFWNTANASLVAEYIPHPQVGSVIMAVDKPNTYIATADTEGIVKVWAISEYCLAESESLVTDPPPLVISFQAHGDIITSIAMAERNDRTLVITGSLDCGVGLWDLRGNNIGTFGQEEHWKILPYDPEEEEMEDTDEEEEEEEEESIVLEPEVDNWEPETEAVDSPATYRLNTWEDTVLGKDYQELRVKKRQRKQPGTIPDLAYIHWERTGDPPAGPYAALNTSLLDPLSQPKKPEFLTNPNKYFSERGEDGNKIVRLPALTERLKAAFDERTLFPRYILDYETKMRQHHQSVVAQQQQQSRPTLKNLLKKDPATNSQTSVKSPPSTRRGSQRPRRLNPLAKALASRRESIQASQD